ncbi:MAG: EAL domain-containing protein [Spirochaetales bacterium]|nr:EAL domain-containing protein [Spirochaetales bacterium]
MNENDIDFFLNESLIENKDIKSEVKYVMYFLKKRIDKLKKEMRNLKETLREREFYANIIQDVTEILAEKNNIDKAAEIIKTRMGLHTCYINYDIDTKTNRANIAGLATNFGVWFSELTKKIQGIPFSFIGEKGEIPLNAAQFISTLKKPITLPPESYCHLFLAKNIHDLNIDVKTVHEFLTTELGSLRINPLKNDRGAMILIKPPGEEFNDQENVFVQTLSHSITLTLDRMYHTYHDELGIKNIVFFKKQLEQLWLEGINHAIVLIKVKGMKQINDYYTHITGNQLLKKIIRRLSRMLKRMGYEYADNLIGRKSGVIIMICVPDISDQAKLEAFMKTVNETLCEPYRLGDYKTLEFDNSLRIGGCLSINAEDTDSLLDSANDALQEARRNTKQQPVIFSKDIERRKVWRKKIIDALKGIDSDDKGYKLKLLYQMKVDTRTNEIIGYEALIRMHNGSPYLMKPGTFIPIAEEEDLIGNIDLWVTREVCIQIMKWVQMGHEIPISVNMSRCHIHNKNLVTEIAGIFNELNFHNYKHLIKIEITETGLLDKRSVDALMLLNKILGLKVTIDDVGKSQANLHTILTLYIHNLLETVKIDKEYIDKLLKHDEKGRIILDHNNEVMLDEDGCKYIYSMLNMFNGLFNTPGIESPKIFCEGVEYQKQVDWLKKNHCFYIQGFLYGMPESPEECEKNFTIKG